MPLPIPIGWVRDAPAPLVEIVSGEADDTTDESLVGKFPTAVPLAFTPAFCAGGGALLVDETRDESSVGNCEVFGFAEAEGAGDGEVAPIGNGSADSGAVPFEYQSVSNTADRYVYFSMVGAASPTSARARAMSSQYWRQLEYEL